MWGEEGDVGIPGEAAAQSTSPPHPPHHRESNQCLSAALRQQGGRGEVRERQRREGRGKMRMDEKENWRMHWKEKVE